MTGTCELRRLLRPGPRVTSPVVQALAALAVITGRLAWSGGRS